MKKRRAADKIKQEVTKTQEHLNSGKTKQPDMGNTGRTIQLKGCETAG